MNSKKRKYVAYMRSAKWKKKREERMRLDNYTCQRCHTGVTDHNPLTVHHLTYQNFGDEPMEDLTTVCVSCHGSIEEGKSFGDSKKPTSSYDDELPF